MDELGFICVQPVTWVLDDQWLVLMYKAALGLLAYLGTWMDWVCEDCDDDDDDESVEVTYVALSPPPIFWERGQPPPPPPPNIPENGVSIHSHVLIFYELTRAPSPI